MFSETWVSCLRNVLYSLVVLYIYKSTPRLEGSLQGFNTLWGQLLSVTTFTLTFFVNQSYALWRKCYGLSRRLQGRLHDVDMTLAMHAQRKTPASPNEPSTYTSASRQLLDLVSRYVRLFNLLTYASFTKSHRPILTPRGMRRLVERGLMTAEERDILVAAEVPATQRHNCILMWITRVAIEGRQAGHFLGGSGFEQQFMEKIHVIRSQYGAIGDELQGRMPLAYAHIVQVLVDCVLLMYPLMAFTSGMAPLLGVLGTGLLTVSYQGLFDLAKQFLDPYDNESYGKGEDPLSVDTLIAETNAGSLRWMYGFEQFPVSSQRIKDGELFDYLLPVRGYSVEELEKMEEERLQREAEIREQRDREEAERIKRIQEAEAEKLRWEQWDHALKVNERLNQRLQQQKMEESKEAAAFDTINRTASSSEESGDKIATINGKRNIASGAVETEDVPTHSTIDSVTAEAGENANSQNDIVVASAESFGAPDDAVTKTSTESVVEPAAVPTQTSHKITYLADGTAITLTEEERKAFSAPVIKGEEELASDHIGAGVDDDDPESVNGIDRYDEVTDEASRLDSNEMPEAAELVEQEDDVAKEFAVSEFYDKQISIQMQSMTINSTDEEMQAMPINATDVDTKESLPAEILPPGTAGPKNPRDGAVPVANGTPSAFVSQSGLDRIDGPSFNGSDLQEMVERLELYKMATDPELFVPEMEDFESFRELPWFEEVGPDGQEVRLSQMLADEEWEEEQVYAAETLEEFEMRRAELQEAAEKEFIETEQIMMASPGARGNDTLALQKEKPRAPARYDQTKLDGISQLWGLPPDDMNEPPGNAPPKDIPKDETSFSNINQLWGQPAEPPTEEAIMIGVKSFDSIDQLWDESTANNDADNSEEPSPQSRHGVDGDTAGSDYTSYNDQPYSENDGDDELDLSAYEGFEWHDGDGDRLSQILAEEVWDYVEPPKKDETMVTLEDYTKKVVEILEAAEDEILETEAILNAPPGADYVTLSQKEDAQQRVLQALNETAGIDLTQDEFDDLEALGMDMDLDEYLNSTRSNATKVDARGSDVLANPTEIYEDEEDPKNDNRAIAEEEANEKAFGSANEEEVPANGSREEGSDASEAEAITEKSLIEPIDMNGKPLITNRTSDTAENDDDADENPEET